MFYVISIKSRVVFNTYVKRFILTSYKTRSNLVRNMTVVIHSAFDFAT